MNEKATPGIWIPDPLCVMNKIAIVSIKYKEIQINFYRSTKVRERIITGRVEMKAVGKVNNLS